MRNVFLLICFFISFKASANLSFIENNIKGTWFNPSLAGQGFQADVILSADGTKTLFMSWYTYSKDGREKLWFALQGNSDSQDTTQVVDLFFTPNGRFNTPPGVNPDRVGSAVIQLLDPRRMRIEFRFSRPDPRWEDGNIDLIKISMDEFNMPILSVFEKIREREVCRETCSSVTGFYNTTCSTTNTQIVATPGCSRLRRFVYLVAVNPEIEFEYPGLKQNMVQAYNTICGFPYREDYSVFYEGASSNVMAVNRFGRTDAQWRYPNGRLIVSRAGDDGADWFYPNGSVIAFGTRTGDTIYYPHPTNQGSTTVGAAVATRDFYEQGADWFYYNGQIITNNAGRENTAWYWWNGRPITLDIGRNGSTWNYPDGDFWMSGPNYSDGDEELLDVPRTLFQIYNRAKN